MTCSPRSLVGFITGLVVLTSAFFFLYSLRSPVLPGAVSLQAWGFLFCLAIPIAWVGVGPWFGVSLLLFSLAVITLAILMGWSSFWLTILVLGIFSFFSYQFSGRIQAKLSQYRTVVEMKESEHNTLEAELQARQSQALSLQQKIVRYQALKDFTHQLSLTLSLTTVVEETIAQTVKLMNAQQHTCLVYLVDRERQELALQGSHRPQGTSSIKHKRGDLFDYWVLKQRQPLIIEDTKKDFRFNIEEETEEYWRAVRSLITAPLKDEKTFLGVLRLDSTETSQFTPDDLRLLSIIADLASTAIRNATLFAISEELAIKDGLTGLYVHRYLLERLEEEIQRAFRSKQPLSLLLMDIDWFKKYNDRFGHMAGDLVLKQLGQRLLGWANPGELVARYGGEEFAILLPECDEDSAVQRAEQILRGIEQETFWLRQEPTHLTLSIGVAAFPMDSNDREELIRHADQALYRAKQQGRSQVCSFS